MKKILLTLTTLIMVSCSTETIDNNKNTKQQNEERPTIPIVVNKVEGTYTEVYKFVYDDIEYTILQTGGAGRSPLLLNKVVR